jgi:hypothetical protein
MAKKKRQVSKRASSRIACAVGVCDPERTEGLQAPAPGQPRAAPETGGICMFITVLAIICLNLAVPGTCLTEPVVNSNQEQLTMGGCLGLLGFESAKEFWEHHPLYHTWKFKGWACQFGNRAPPERGKA